MGKLVLTLALLFGFSIVTFAASSTSNIYVGNRVSTVTGITITSTTVNFPINDIRFTLESVAGDYAVVQSSWGKTATDYIYVTSDAPFKETYSNAPIDLRGTSMGLKITIPSGSTFYYYIGGHK